MPFGSPEEVRAEAEERLRVLGRDGGLVFCSIHNIQAKTPVENVLAFFEAAKGEPVVAR
jgi:uroporphyrinogen-III decarboxylase